MKMGENAKALSMPEAAADIVKQVIRIVKKREKQT